MNSSLFFERRENILLFTFSGILTTCGITSFFLTSNVFYSHSNSKFVELIESLHIVSRYFGKFKEFLMSITSYKVRSCLYK